MVARPDPAGDAGPPGPDQPVAGLFHAWRRVVTRAARIPGVVARAASGSKAAGALRLAVRYLADPPGTLSAASPSDRERLKEAGAAALVAGALAAYAVAITMGVSPLRGFLSMGWTAAWALTRLLVMRLALPAGSANDRWRVDAAWGPALLPYAAAVVFPLDLIALGVSAWLTYRGLVTLGVARGPAKRAVAWAFAGQLAAETVAWMGRAGLLAFISL